MTVQRFKRPFVLLTSLAVVLLVVTIKLARDYGVLRVQTAWADEQVKIFDSLRKKASEGGITNAVVCLEYVVGYYPSGTKQTKGSSLDGRVEQKRAEAVRQIVNHLRTIGDNDLGEDPQAWIRAYADGY